jgi:hypothetical protein
MYQRLGALLVLAVLSAQACGDSTIPTTPTTPVTITTTPFSGTLTVNGANTHPFTATGRGTVTVTLTSIGPDTTTIIGLSFGIWNGTACQIWKADDQAAQGDFLDGVVSGVGELCVRVYDVGNLTAPATYSVDVSHP